MVQNMNKKILDVAIAAAILVGCGSNPQNGEGKEDNSLREAAIAAALTPGVSRWCAGVFGFEGCLKKDRTVDVPQLKALIEYLETKGLITTRRADEEITTAN